MEYQVYFKINDNIGIEVANNVTYIVKNGEKHFAWHSSLKETDDFIEDGDYKLNDVMLVETSIKIKNYKDTPYTILKKYEDDINFRKWFNINVILANDLLRNIEGECPYFQKLLFYYNKNNRDLYKSVKDLDIFDPKLIELGRKYLAKDDIIYFLTTYKTMENFNKRFNDTFYEMLNYFTELGYNEKSVFKAIVFKDKVIIFKDARREF